MPGTTITLSKSVKFIFFYRRNLYNTLLNKLKTMVLHFYMVIVCKRFCTDQALKDNVKKAVMDTMKVHMTSVEIQTLACHVLGNSAVIGNQTCVILMFFVSLSCYSF